MPHGSHTALFMHCMLLLLLFLMLCLLGDSNEQIFDGLVLEQTFVVEFVVIKQQSPEVQASYTAHTWKAAVQVRQRVNHKRTIFLLEQIILKHKAFEKVTNVKEVLPVFLAVCMFRWCVGVRCLESHFFTSYLTDTPPFPIQMPDGIDFFFAHRGHALQFLDFVCSVVPCRYFMHQFPRVDDSDWLQVWVWV
mgnify:CR=1 FL=1